MGWTADAYLAGVKSVTRRDWKPSHAAKFKPGDVVRVLDKGRRSGGMPIGELKVISCIYESTLDAPMTDWTDEGFQWMTDHGLMVNGHEPFLFWRSWQLSPKELWTLRFRALSGKGSDDE